MSAETTGGGCRGGGGARFLVPGRRDPGSISTLLSQTEFHAEILAPTLRFSFLREETARGSEDGEGLNYWCTTDAKLFLCF